MATFVLSAEELPRAVYRGGAVTVGNFDGVHRGHTVLMAELTTQADKIHGPAVAVTFDPHPVALLAPERLQPPLTTIEDRADRLHRVGVDHVVILRTTPELLAMDAPAFLDNLLGAQLVARAVVEGFNFRFGHDRTGDTEMLTAWCRDRETPLSIVQPYSLDGGVVSSSRVRTALESGNIWATTRLLGRPYRLRGVVGVGAKRGQTLGFPTANLEQPATLVPGDGVYAVLAELDDGTVWPAAANVGPNPTFGESSRKFEVHLIGFKGDLYGQQLAVDFVARLRDTRPFSGRDELVNQLHADVQAAQRLCS
jgi:riboflavin kinase/FMN adenylyltransferase